MSKKKKIAFITGITGQDGSYLLEFLINKNYEVHGLKRRTSLFNTDRIDHLYTDPHDNNPNFYMHHGDMTDGESLIRIIQQVKPDEVYNLAAQSHVAVSFEQPEYTANVDALGALRILEAIRILKLENKTKFYQASTSELFGKTKQKYQSESTPFYPRSPYAVAKLYAYWITINYREAYNIFGCNGILFNHESPVRGETFVTRKITRGLSRIKIGLQNCIYIGNLDSKRDWGHARDYAEMQWLMLQQEKPEDFVIATGEQHSVREFINLSAKELGMTIKWKGSGISEECILIDKNNNNNNRTIVKVDKKYFRPTEVDNLLGDAKKAKTHLGWSVKTPFKKLVKEMITEDLKLAKKEDIIQKHGYKVFNRFELS